MSNPSQDKPKGEVFLFEDIMREYGSKVETAPEPKPQAPAVEPEETVQQVVAEEKPKKIEKPKIIPLRQEEEVTSSTPKEEPSSPPVRERPHRPRRQRPAPQQKKEAKAQVAEEAPTISLAEANKQVGSCGSLRGHFIGFLGAIAVLMTLAFGLGLPMGGLESNVKTLSMVLLGMLLLSACVALDVMKNGIFHMMSGKIRLDGLLSVAVVVFIIHGFSAVNSGELPYATIGIMGLAFGVSGKSLENRSKKKIYRGMISLREKPLAILSSPNVYEELSGIHKGEGDVEGVVPPLENNGKPDKVLGAYGITAIFVSALVAIAISMWRGGNVISIWAAILGGSLPAFGLVAFWKPFWKGTCQLAKNGTVLCGWQGVEKLGKKPKLVTTEQDLFMGNQVTVNGMKVYPQFEIRQIVGYVHAVMDTNGGGLAPVFSDLHQQQNGLDFTVNQFKRYDNGGLGAEIQADVVLVGSLGFMKLMGVRMPEGANLKQAVYCSVNGDLAGVFVLHYLPSAMVKNAMHAYVRSGGAGLILATKDFILTPAAVRHYYKVPAGWMEYPKAEERATLAEGNMEDSTLVGMMARMNFGAVLEAAMVGKTIHSQTSVGLAVSLLWGISGLILTSVVSALGAYGVASPFNLTVFALLWTFTAWVLSAVQRK